MLATFDWRLRIFPSGFHFRLEGKEISIELLMSEVKIRLSRGTRDLQVRMNMQGGTCGTMYWQADVVREQELNVELYSEPCWVEVICGWDCAQAEKQTKTQTQGNCEEFLKHHLGMGSLMKLSEVLSRPGLMDDWLGKIFYCVRIKRITLHKPMDRDGR